MRKNGFQQPWNAHQIASYILFSTYAVSFFTVLSPLLTPTLDMILTTLFAALLVAIFILGYKCTLCDPSDPALLEASGGSQVAEAFGDCR